MKNGFNVKTLWVRFYVLVTISSLWSDWGLQVSLLLVLVLLHHLRRQLSRGHSDEGLSPETKATPTVTVSSCHTHSLFAAPLKGSHLMCACCLAAHVLATADALRPRLFLMVLVIWESSRHTKTQL